MHDQGSEFIGHEFSKYLIKREYGLTDKTSTLDNPNSNEILEQIHQVLRTPVLNFHITETYVD